MNRNTNLCFICTSYFRVGNKPKVFHNQNVMSKLIRVGEYLGKMIARSTSYIFRYILQEKRVGKYSRIRIYPQLGLCRCNGVHTFLESYTANGRLKYCIHDIEFEIP